MILPRQFEIKVIKPKTGNEVGQILNPFKCKMLAQL